MPAGVQGERVAVDPGATAASARSTCCPFQTSTRRNRRSKRHARLSSASMHCVPGWSAVSAPLRDDYSGSGNGSGRSTPASIGGPHTSLSRTDTTAPSAATPSHEVAPPQGNSAVPICSLVPMERRVERGVWIPAIHEPSVLKRREWTPAVTLDVNIPSHITIRHTERVKFVPGSHAQQTVLQHDNRCLPRCGAIAGRRSARNRRLRQTSQSR